MMPTAAQGRFLSRAGGNVAALKTGADGCGVAPAQGGRHGGEVQVGRDLTNILNLTDKEAQKRGDQFIASEMFLLALTATKARLDVC